MKRLILTFLAALLPLLAPAGDYTDLYRDLPIGIARPATPGIPAYTVNLTDFGGVGDGVTLNTEAFAAALKALRKAGGGHLVVPPGVFLTGPVELQDRTDLHLERGALILFSPDKRDFLKKGKIVPGILAKGKKDVSITGEGIIDGNGEWWRGVKRGKVSDVEWNRFRSMGGTVEGNIWYPFGLKYFPDVAGEALAQEKMRTHLVRFTSCERVLVQGVTIQNAPKFHLVPQFCTDVVVDGVTVRCPWNAQNGDGIDIMQSRRVLVVRCTVDVGDDGICLKAGGGPKAAENGPVEDVLIRDNTVYHAHGGFVIGSEFSAGVYRVAVLDNTFSGTDTGLRFKSGAGRGGRCGDIWISDIRMSDIADEAVVFETTYTDRPVGREDAPSATAEDFIPEFTGIRISRVTCRDARVGVAARGAVGTIHGITLSESLFFYTEKASEIGDPSMVTLAESVRFLTF